MATEILCVLLDGCNNNFNHMICFYLFPSWNLPLYSLLASFPQYDVYLPESTNDWQTQQPADIQKNYAVVKEYHV